MADNKLKYTINPFTGELMPMPDIAWGMTVRNEIISPMTIRSGYTHIHPNAKIKEGIDVVVEEDGELAVI
jgi:hypothetical protein